jgi:hypothetical protein
MSEQRGGFAGWGDRLDVEMGRTELARLRSELREARARSVEDAASMDELVRTHDALVRERANRGRLAEAAERVVASARERMLPNAVQEFVTTVDPTELDDLAAAATAHRRLRDTSTEARIEDSSEEPTT